MLLGTQTVEVTGILRVHKVNIREQAEAIFLGVFNQLLKTVASSHGLFPFKPVGHIGIHTAVEIACQLEVDI